jgi:hypothetical protein
VVRAVGHTSPTLTKDTEVRIILNEDRPGAAGAERRAQVSLLQPGYVDVRTDTPLPVDGGRYAHGAGADRVAGDVGVGKGLVEEDLRILQQGLRTTLPANGDEGGFGHRITSKVTQMDGHSRGGEIHAEHKAGSLREGIGPRRTPETRW